VNPTTLVLGSSALACTSTSGTRLHSQSALTGLFWMRKEVSTPNGPLLACMSRTCGAFWLPKLLLWR